MTQPSADDWAAWLQTWRCSTPEMAAELAGRVAAVVEEETRQLRRERDALVKEWRSVCAEETVLSGSHDRFNCILCEMLDAELDALRTENERLQQQGPA